MDQQQQRLTHTSRVLQSMQKEFAIKARSEGRDGFIHSAKTVKELGDEYLLWLRERMHKQPE